MTWLRYKVIYFICGFRVQSKILQSCRAISQRVERVKGKWNMQKKGYTKQTLKLHILVRLLGSKEKVLTKMIIIADNWIFVTYQFLSRCGGICFRKILPTSSSCAYLYYWLFCLLVLYIYIYLFLCIVIYCLKRYYLLCKLISRQPEIFVLSCLQLFVSSFFSLKWW